MQHKKRKHIVEFSLLAIFVVSIFLCAAGIIFSISRMQSNVEHGTVQQSERKYSILITGTSDNEAFLSSVCDGTKSVCNFYDSAIQFYVPNSRAENYSLESLFDYATCINADCIITFVDSYNQKIPTPKDINGNPIPLITVGTYSAQNSQISHIGINYAELGELLAHETSGYINGEGKVFILNTNETNDVYASTLVNHVYNKLNENTEIKILNPFIPAKSEFNIEDVIRQQIASSGQIDIIISLSEQSTVIAAQTILDLNLRDKTIIIGYGEGKDSYSYFEKGIITELISVDKYNIGKKAVQEFYEYKKNGSANSYVTADILLLKQDKK